MSKNENNTTAFYMGADHGIPILILVFFGIVIVTIIGLLLVFTAT